MLLVKITILLWAITLIAFFGTKIYVVTLSIERQAEWLLNKYTDKEMLWLTFNGLLWLVDVIGFLYIVVWFLFLR